MVNCKTLYFNSMLFFIAVITMKSHGVKWFYAALLLVSVLYIIGFFKAEKSNPELQLSISDIVVYSVLGRLFDKVLVRESSLFYEVTYIFIMIVFFYFSVATIDEFLVSMILSALLPIALGFVFIKLGFFKFYEARSATENN